MTPLPWTGLTCSWGLYTFGMPTLQAVPGIKPVGPSTPTGSHVGFSALRYLAGKALTILVAIVVVVFITLLIVNFPGERMQQIHPTTYAVSRRTNPVHDRLCVW